MDRTRYLYIIAAVCGFVTLGAELTASRLLAPYFGTSLVVWSSLIGLILIALACGYWLGGDWADRRPDLSVLLLIVTGAGIGLALIPLVSRTILGLAFRGLAEFEFGLLLGSFLGVMVLLGPSMLLLGCVTPFAVRLAARDPERTGGVAGRLFALSTVGSFFGVFVPTLVLVPVLGTRLTFVLLGASLFVLSSLGHLLLRRTRRAAVSGLLLLLTLLWGLASASSPIKPGADLVFEAESPYQYVRVSQTKDGWTLLQLNEGLVIHSKYHPDRVLTFGEWDFVAMAPFFNPAPYDPTAEARSWAIIGAGAGTTPRLVNRLYAPERIVGVELDPVVAEVGRRFFDADFENYEVVVLDGRAWLTLDTGRYDVIAVDAYRQPYIPFELATVEFFELAAAHLSDPGVVAINVSSPPGDPRLVDALASTMEQVFVSLFLVELPANSMATIIVGTNRASSVADVQANFKKARGATRALARRTAEYLTQDFNRSQVLTDDKAPIERLIDLMVIRQMFEFEPPGGTEPQLQEPAGTGDSSVSSWSQPSSPVLCSQRPSLISSGAIP